MRNTVTIGTIAGGIIVAAIAILNPMLAIIVGIAYAACAFLCAVCRAFWGICTCTARHMGGNANVYLVIAILVVILAILVCLCVMYL